MLIKTQPDWGYWIGTRIVDLLQAIALSMNIDPNSHRLEKGALFWDSCGIDFEKTFGDRLKLLESCDVIKHGSKIKLSDFAKWAVEEAKLDPIPPELAAMAPTVKAPDPVTAEQRQAKVIEPKGERERGAMELFKTASGYVPLVPNFMDRLKTPSADLPSELRAIIEEHFSAYGHWDSLDVETRRNLITQHDDQSDPRHERSLYFKFANFADDELKDRIERAEQDSKDSVALALRKVFDRINEILAVDRDQEGTKLQEWRADHDRVVELRSALAAKDQELSQANERIRQLEDAKAQAVTESTTRWPWGNHETELLRKIAAAAEKWWQRYDATDATTAPTNQQVIDWLKGQGVAERTAEVVATILRADGLAPGPRK